MALVLMVALTSSLYVCFRIAFKSQDHTEAALAPARTALQALELMRLDLESAMVPNNVLAGPFEGTPGRPDPGRRQPDREPRHRQHGRAPAPTATRSRSTPARASPDDPSVALAAAAAPGADPERATRPTTTACDIRMVTYSLAPQPNDTTGTLFLLQRSITTNLLAPETPTPVQDNICANVLGLTFQYFDGTNWWPNWDSTQQGNTLPTAVQVTLQLQPPVVGPAGPEQSAGPVRGRAHFPAAVRPVAGRQPD